MNVISSLSHLFERPPARSSGTQACSTGRVDCAEAVAEARRRAVEPDDLTGASEEEQAAYAAQCRRVGESSYLSASGRLFQVH